MLSVVDLLTYAVGLNTVYCNLVINILIIRGGHLPGKPKKKVWLLKVVGENLDIFSMQSAILLNHFCPFVRRVAALHLNEMSSKVF